MVNYDNPDLFYDHDETHLIIVNAGATVTGVSNDEPTITDADFIITEEDITDDEIEVRECLCGADNLKFGTLESSCFRVSIFDSDSIPYLKDEEIKVYIYFDGDSSTLFQIGRYIVREDKYSDDRSIRDLTAYDIIQYLRDYDITEWYYTIAYSSESTRTIKWLRDSLFTWLNQDIEDYNITQEETNLVNDTWLVEKSIESDVVTFGFFMQGIAEFNGVFPHIDRQGIFRYIQMQWYDKPAVKTFDEEQIFPPIQYGGNDKEITVWGIGYVIVYDRNNTRIAKVGSTNKKHPSNYTIIDSFVITNNLKRFGWKDSLKTALANLREVITHLRYKPFEGDFEGNLCLEVGDRIDVQLEDYDEETDYTDDEVPIIKTFYSYILERTCRGLQEFEDNYIARGDKKQPKYVVKNDKWHAGDTDSETVVGAGGISLYDDNVAKWFVQVIRNIGLRLLDEPDNVSVVYNKQSGQVEIKWEDPIDITTFNPVPAEWAGTVVVRKEGSVPLHRYGGKWGGTLLTNSQVRDQYKNDAYVDNTVEVNKKYYYGIFPYSIALDDEDHPIRHYRFTKVISVDTTVYLMAPTIESLEVENVNVTVTYDIPEIDGLYSYCKLVVKKGGIPVDVEDGDVILTLNESLTEVEVTGLDAESRYYFVIFTADTDGNTANSDSPDAVTGIDEGWNYVYTGQEEVFEAPITGVYSLETWGAQGGDATDGTNTARGGYGAYAYGEVFLNAGDKLYINVGGQDGYNGGGNGSITYDVKNIAKTLNYEHIKSGASYSNLTEWYLTDWWLYFNQINENQPVRYADDKFYFLETDASTADNTQVHTLVPIPRLTNVVNIKFKVRRTAIRSTTHWNQLYLNFVYIGDNNSYNRVYVINVNSPVQEGNLIVTTPNLNEWYEFETGEISISMIDYVEFVRTYAGYDIKDIEITCAT